MLPLARNHPFTTDPYGSQDAAKHDLLTEPIIETIVMNDSLHPCLLVVEGYKEYMEKTSVRHAPRLSDGRRRYFETMGSVGTTRPLSRTEFVRHQLTSLCIPVRLLWTEADYQQKRGVFAMVFSIVWIGATVVTVNAALLGSKM